MPLYVSPYKNYRQPIHKGIPERHPATGDIIGWKIHPLAAAFGKVGDEQMVFNPLTQTMEVVADIQGGVYDTAVAQENEGWTDEERVIVETALDKACETTPLFIRKLNPVHVAAPAPWQTYDATKDARVVTIAAELGLVPEALRYERENANRPDIVAALEAGLDPGEVDRAKPLEKIDAHVEKPAARIAKPPRTTRTGIVVDTPGLTLKDAPEVEQPEPVAGRVVG